MKTAIVLLLFTLSSMVSAVPMTLPKDPCNEGEGKIKMRKSIDDRLIELISYANPNYNPTIWDLKYTSVGRLPGALPSADVIVTFNQTLKRFSGETQTDFMAAQMNIDKDCNATLIRLHSLKAE